MKHYAILFCASLFLFTLASCDKDDSATPQYQEESVMLAEDLSSTDYLVESTEELSDEIIDFRSFEGNCPTVTSSAPLGTFPNTVTFDFGDGCTGPKGHIHSGVILVVQSAPIHEDGATRVTTFDQYFVDGVQMLGTISLTNLGEDTEGNKSFSRTVSEAQLIFPDQTTVNWNSSYTRTQIAGGNTNSFMDDVFAISGSASGVNRAGLAFSSVITEDLIKARNCRWVSEGIVELSYANGTRSINYGVPNTNCNDIAELTLANGQTRLIHIHRRWW